jgi:hypothetical protein
MHTIMHFPSHPRRCNPAAWCLPGTGSFSCIVDLLKQSSCGGFGSTQGRPLSMPQPRTGFLDSIPWTFLGWPLPYLEGTAAGAHFRVVAWVMHDCGYLLHMHSKSVAPKPSFLKHTLLKTSGQPCLFRGCPKLICRFV